MTPSRLFYGVALFYGLALPGATRFRRAVVGLLLAASLLGLAACAATPDEAGLPLDWAALKSPAPDQGRIYFYRPTASLFPLIRPEVIVNGRLVGISRSGEVFYRDAYPGRYEIYLVGEEERTLTLTVAAGETQYVRTSIDLALLGPRLAPEAVEAPDAQREIRDLQLVAPLGVE